MHDVCTCFLISFFSVCLSLPLSQTRISVRVLFFDLNLPYRQPRGPQIFIGKNVYFLGKSKGNVKAKGLVRRKVRKSNLIFTLFPIPISKFPFQPLLLMVLNSSSGHETHTITLAHGHTHARPLRWYIFV